MSTIDTIILIVYLIGMVTVGVCCSRKSATSMKAYFLGNNESKWWMLAASGAASSAMPHSTGQGVFRMKIEGRLTCRPFRMLPSRCVGAP